MSGYDMPDQRPRPQVSGGIDRFLQTFNERHDTRWVDENQNPNFEQELLAPDDAIIMDNSLEKR